MKDVNVGLHKCNVKVKMGDIYNIVRSKRPLIGEWINFNGKLIHETINHFTLINKYNIKESFLKVDILLGVYKIDKGVRLNESNKTKW